MKNHNGKPTPCHQTELLDADFERQFDEAFERAIAQGACEQKKEQDKEQEKAQEKEEESDPFFELLFDKGPGFSEPLFNKDTLRENWSHRGEKEVEGFDAFLRANPRKKLAENSPRASQLEALRQEFPNFREVIDFFEGQLAIRQRTGKPLNIPPINLQGVPGIGKTVFVQALATALALEFFDLHISGMQGELEIVGGNHMWAKANVGAIATTLVLRAKTYHPVILLDEICLLSKNDKVDMYHPLYGILDKEQARRFRDNFLDVTIDASHAVYVTTTNNIERVPEALRSRLINFDVRPPSYDESLALVPKILRSVLNELSLTDSVSENLPEVALKIIAHNAPREIKLILKNAVGQALRRDQTSDVVRLGLSDFQLQTGLSQEAAEFLH